MWEALWNYVTLDSILLYRTHVRHSMFADTTLDTSNYVVNSRR